MAWRAVVPMLILLAGCSAQTPYVGDGSPSLPLCDTLSLPPPQDGARAMYNWSGDALPLFGTAPHAGAPGELVVWARPHMPQWDPLDGTSGQAMLLEYISDGARTREYLDADMASAHAAWEVDGAWHWRIDDAYPAAMGASLLWNRTIPAGTAVGQEWTRTPEKQEWGSFEQQLYGGPSVYEYDDRIVHAYVHDESETLPEYVRASMPVRMHMEAASCQSFVTTSFSPVGALGYHAFVSITMLFVPDVPLPLAVWDASRPIATLASLETGDGAPPVHDATAPCPSTRAPFDQTLASWSEAMGGTPTLAEAWSAVQDDPIWRLQHLTSAPEWTLHHVRHVAGDPADWDLFLMDASQESDAGTHVHVTWSRPEDPLAAAWTISFHSHVHGAASLALGPAPACLDVAAAWGRVLDEQGADQLPPVWWCDGWLDLCQIAAMPAADDRSAFVDEPFLPFDPYAERGAFVVVEASNASMLWSRTPVWAPTH